MPNYCYRLKENIFGIILLISVCINQLISNPMAPLHLPDNQATTVPIVPIYDPNSVLYGSIDFSGITLNSQSSLERKSIIRSLKNYYK